MLLDNIKLIIWDLDETLWKGTLSEGGVLPIEENIYILQETLDMGIMHSICSKNDYETAKNNLISMGIWDCFVFPSINWEGKGHRLAQIIEHMRLRPQNILFVDDNIQNLQEAKFYCSGIIAVLPSELDQVKKEISQREKLDPKRSRLKKYKLLEQKEKARDCFVSNDDFLMTCNIRVEIRHDCLQEEERIHELILRSNQLNYTKIRSTKEELRQLIQNEEVQTGYIEVSDKFGDYGIVGFYALKGMELLHFVFSCRTLGMRVEQYIYHMLGYPEIQIRGEVAFPLCQEAPPRWINQAITEQERKITKSRLNGKILLKGPCDMSQMYAFLGGNTDHIVTEFTYTNAKGISVEGYNHTAQIATALQISDERKADIVSEVDFFDDTIFRTALQHERFDAVVLSMLTDGNLGVYRRKETGEQIALCEKKYSLTDPANHSRYIAEEVFTSGIKFTSEDLASFTQLYEQVMDCSGENTVAGLQIIWEHIGPETVLILLLGSEHPFHGQTKLSYEGRHLEHKKMNDEIRSWSKGKDNVVLIEYDRYIKSQNDYLDTINHFVKRVYYDLAQDLLSVIQARTTCSVTVKGRQSLYMATIGQIARRIRTHICEYLHL